MELNIAYTFLTGILLFVLYYDVKHRLIHIIWPILIFSLTAIINYFSVNLTLNDVIYNMGFVCINILGLTMYFSLKSKGFINPIDTSIGLGDVVFFLAITPLFNFKSYILFFISGLVFSLLAHVITLRFKKVKTIPLAGYLSLFLAMSLIIKTMIKINIPL